ncbi:PAS domain-containing protein [Nitrospiraceae bacterium AH_259_D15_M11_P09]|nr:PAS domain-containing protein [Nitrospiraceae bacterium AH_259_D15_M11_P09]
MKRQKKRVHKDLQGLYQEAPIGLCSLDTNLRYIQINDWLAALNGLPVEAHLGRTLREVLPDVAAGVEQQLRKVIGTGEPVIDGRVDAETPAHPGVVRTFQHHYYPNRSKDGRIVGVSCVVVDINERKRAEEALRESQERFDLAVRGTSDGLWVWNPITNEEWLAPRWKELLGYTDEELPSTYENWESRLHPDDRGPTLEAVRLHLEQNRPYDIEFQLRTKSGDYRWFRARATSLRDATGKAYRMAGSIQDITDRKQAEAALRRAHDVLESRVAERTASLAAVNAQLEADITERNRAEVALRESEERFRQMAEKIREVFWMTTPDKGEMLYVSPAYEEIWGRTCHSLYKEPRSWLDAIHPDDRPRVMAAAHEKQVGGAYDEEYRIVRPDEAVRWIRDRGFPVTDDGGQVYRVAGIAEDITERKRAEEALRERERELRRLLEEREQMSRDLHDGIIQSIYAVGLGLDECRRLIHHDATASAERVEEAITNLNSVIRDIRQYLTGPQPMKMNGQEFKSALTSLVEQIGNGHMPRFSLDIDEAAADQVTAEEAPHLLYIAREAMSNCLRHSRARRAVVSLQTHDGGVRLQVEDDGVGFEVQAADTRGHGLRNIEARAVTMRAQLQIESERGRGTRVVLHVPKERGGVSAQTPTCG